MKDLILIPPNFESSNQNNNIPGDISTQLYIQKSEVNMVVQYNVVVGDSNTINTKKLGFNEISSVFFNNLYGNFKKEELYLTVMKNLLKTKNFLQLCIQHSEKAIDDNEFETEINENKEKYVIEIQELKNVNDLYHISDIVSKLNTEFELHEVSEMFSLTSDSIIRMANLISKNNGTH